MTLPKCGACVLGAILLASVGVPAQSVTKEQHEKTKIEVKNGKPVTLTGCIERVGNASAFILTDERGTLQYALVTEDDLSNYVDRRVRVKGNAADLGDGRVKIEHKVVGTSGTTSDTKIEQKGDSAELPYLGLKSIKTIAGSCR